MHDPTSTQVPVVHVMGALSNGVLSVYFRVAKHRSLPKWQGSSPWTLFWKDQRERLAFASIIVREILGDNGSTCPRLLGSSEVGRHHSLGRLRSRELAKSLIKRHCYATHWASFKFVPVTCLPLSHKDVASDDGIVIKTELVLLNLTRNVHVSGKGIQY